MAVRDRKQGGAGTVGRCPLRIYGIFVSWQFPIHDGDIRRDLEVKQGFRKRRIKLPIGEFELHRDATGLGDPNPVKDTGSGIDF